jgi:hypothetical protein
VPTVDTVDLGLSANPFKMVYSHRITTDAFVIDSLLAGGTDCIYPKVDGAGTLGKSGNAFADVTSGAFHGNYYITSPSSTVGLATHPFGEVHAVLAYANVITPNGAAHSVGTAVAPFSSGYINSVHYRSKTSRMYYQYINTEPTVPATHAVDIDLTSGDNEYDEIFLDFFFSSTESTVPFVAERSPDPLTETKCWLELPDASNYYNSNGSREITVTIRTKISGSFDHYLGIGVDKAQTNNVRVVRLKDTGIDGWVQQIHNLKFRAMSTVDTQGDVANLAHAGWNCTSYTLAELSNTYTVIE